MREEVVMHTRTSVSHTPFEVFFGGDVDGREMGSGGGWGRGASRESDRIG